MVNDLCIKLGLNVSPTVGNAIGDPTQGKGLLDVGEYLDFAVYRDFLPVNYGGEAKIPDIVISKLGGDHCQGFYCNDVHGIYNAFS